MSKFLPLLLLLARPLGAHECWLQPSSFNPAPGEAVSLGIRVGMEFNGEVRPVSLQRVARLQHFSAAGREDWTGRVPGQDGPAADLALKLETPGPHVLAYDSRANLITLEADKFHDYLREDGMEHVIALREKAGTAGAPGRERYRRCAKTLLQCGPAATAAWSAPTGQEIEIIPLANPATLRPGATLRFRVLFRREPLADRLVQAWHRAGDKTTVVPARSSATGEVEFNLPAAGPWMISTVHMIAVPNDPEADWESYWGNLTFSLQP